MIAAAESKLLRAPHPGVRTVLAVSVICFIIAANLDIPAAWLYKHDNLLEAIYSYQVMISTNGLLGIRNWRMSNAYMQLAFCYGRMGRNQEAIFAGKQARAIMAAVSGEHSANVCVLDAEMATWMSHSKDYAGAEKLLTSTLQQLDHIKPDNLAVRAYALSVLLDAYMDQKNYQKAEETALLLIPVDEEAQREARSGTYGGRQRLVEAYCQTKRLPEAEQTALEGLIFAEALGEPLARCDAHDALGRVKLAQGQLADARMEFDKALSFLKASPGTDAHKVALWAASYERMLADKNPYPERN